MNPMMAMAVLYVALSALAVHAQQAAPATSTEEPGTTTEADPDARLSDPAVQAWIETFEAQAEEPMRGRGGEVMLEFWRLTDPYADTAMDDEVRSIMQQRAKDLAIRNVRERVQRQRDAERQATVISYMEIPITGEIGKDVQADGVVAAIEHASRQSLKHVVLRIRTPGGQVAEAEKIGQAILRHPEMSFHAVVEEGVSAGIWIIFACDTISVTEQGIIGGAVAFQHNQTTGAAEVDAKMNSILTAALTSMAERKGYSPSLLRAMTLPGVELWAWKDPHDVVHVAESAPPAGGDSQLILHVSKDEVLTLRPSQAVALGWAQWYDPQQFPPGVDRSQFQWVESKPTGRFIMDRVAERQEVAARRATRAAAKEQAEIEADANTFPYSYEYEINLIGREGEGRVTLRDRSGRRDTVTYSYEEYRSDAVELRVFFRNDSDQTCRFNFNLAVGRTIRRFARPDKPVILGRATHTIGALAPGEVHEFRKVIGVADPDRVTQADVGQVVVTPLAAE